MQIESDSRQQTEEEIKQLHKEQIDLISEIVDKDDKSMGEKILLLAQKYERLIDLNDPMLPKEFTINQISTEITRSLRANQCKIAPWVSEYLPEKYKNANLSKWGKLAHNVHEIAIGSVLPSQPLEQCSTEFLVPLLELFQKFKREGGGNIFDNSIDEIRRILLDRGVKEAGGEKLRDPISARDYRFEIPDDAELEELNKEVVTQCERVIYEYDVFIHKKYPVYPATTKEKARQYGNAFRVYANMMAIVNEEKWSGDVDLWFDRNYWKKSQSSHKSGNSTFFPTTLCAKCSANVDEDPKDFHVVRYDSNSPTGYRCDNCGGTKIMKRFNSREQVGDKSAEMDRLASEIVNHIPHYVDVFQDVRKNNMNPAIYARKRAIANRFRIASMGKEEIVVPRKKAK